MTELKEYRFDPRLYIDREWHQDHLRKMLLRRTDSRALLISDVSGQGKSDLLLRMRLNCLEGDPRASVLLADVRDLATPFSMLERAYRNDQNADTFDDHFAEFCQVYQAWSTTATLNLEGTGGRNEVLLDANHAYLGANASVIGQMISATPAGVDNREAQRQSLLAFGRDLRTTRHRPLAVLIDHYNRAEPAVQTWLDEKLLRPCLLGELSDVVVVLASTPEAEPSYANDLEPYVTRRALARLEEDRSQVEGVLRAHRLLSDDSPDYILNLAVDQLMNGRKVAEMIEVVRVVITYNEVPRGH